MTVTHSPTRDRRVSALSRLVELLALRVPLAVDVLQDQTAYLDGWSTRGDDPHVTTSMSSSTVELQALQADDARRTIAQIYDDIDTLSVQVHDMLRMVDRICARRPPDRIEPKLCDCRGRDGADLPWTPGLALAAGNGWSDPTCRNVASRGPLCDSCALREHRFRAHHNMPARKDGVFSQPAHEPA